MLVVALMFALMAFVLFVERSGIRYNYNRSGLELLENSEIVTKQEAIAPLAKNTLLIGDATQLGNAEMIEEFQVVLSDMKMGYDIVDLSQSPFPDLSKYKKAIVLISDLSPMGENVITLKNWVYNGGKVLFAQTLQRDIYVSVLEGTLGIREASWENAHLESIYIEDGFMVGGGREFEIEDGYPSAWSVRLDEDIAKAYAWIGSERKTPLIWEAKHGKGKFVVYNIGIYEKAMRGFYAASISLMDDICVYPVINASTFYLDDFPSQIPQGSNEYIMRDYGATTREFYVNIWWPAMMDLADRYKIKYTGLAITGYDDIVDGTTPSEPDEGTFLNFGNMLLRQGGEIGYHGYNHQPLCMSECDYGDLYDYKTWENPAAIEDAFGSLVDLCDRLFHGVDVSLYVPPSNIMSEQGEAALLDAYPHIKTISGIYFPDGDFEFGCVQEFESFSDGHVHQPRIISGCDLTPYMERALVSELNMHFINSHFTHPDDALDPERGAEKGWEYLAESFEEYLDYLYTSAPMIRNFTGSETSAAVQRYSAINVKTEREEDKLILKLGNFRDEAYFFVRFNVGEYEDVDGGKLIHLTGNLYLLEAKKETVTIKLK